MTYGPGYLSVIFFARVRFHVVSQNNPVYIKATFFNFLFINSMINSLIFSYVMYFFAIDKLKSDY